MHSSFGSRCKSSALVSVALIAILTLLCSGWTCSAMFVSCQGVGSQPQAASLFPNSIPHDAQSVMLTVEGSGFTPQSQILWNGRALQTTVVERNRLQTTVTEETLESLGALPGGVVQISVASQGTSLDMGCPIGGKSSNLILAIN